MKQLMKLVEQNGVRYNRELLRGQASQVSHLLPVYLDRIYASSAKALPANIRYLGLRLVPSPTVEYQHLSRASGGKPEISQSTMGMYQLSFALLNSDGTTQKVITRYQQLSYINADNTMMFSNAAYTVRTLLKDPMFSPDGNRLYLGLLRTRTMIGRVPYLIKINDEISLQQIAASRIYRGSKRLKGRNRPETTLPHYLFAKFGPIQAFKQYLNMDLTIHTASVKQSPDYVVISSAKGLCNYRLTIPAQQYSQDPATANLFAAALILVAETGETTAIRPDSIKTSNAWAFALGHIIFGKDRFQNDGRYLSLIKDHFQTIETYVDPMAITMYHTQGYTPYGPMNNISDLFFICTKNINDWLTNRTQAVFNRFTDVIATLLYPLVKAFNMFVIMVNRCRTRDEPSLAEFTRLTSSCLTLGKSYLMVNCANVSPGQPHALHPWLDGCSQFAIVIPGQKPGEDLPPTSPALNYDPTSIGLGSPLAVTQSAPMALNHVNPTAKHVSIVGQGQGLRLKPHPNVTDVLDR